MLCSFTEERQVACALHFGEALGQHVRSVLDDGVGDVGHRLAVAARSCEERFLRISNSSSQYFVFSDYFLLLMAFSWELM